MTYRTVSDFDPMVRQAIEPTELMQRVADQALASIDASDGVLVGLCDADEQFITYVCGSGRLSSFVGTRVRMDASLPGLAVSKRQVLSTDDASADPRADSETGRSMGVRSSVCVPLHRGEMPVGVLDVSSSRKGAFDAADVATLAHLAEFMSVVVAAASDFDRVSKSLLDSPEPTKAKRARFHTNRTTRPGVEGQFVANVLSPELVEGLVCRRKIETILEASAYSTVFQPVFDLSNGHLVGVEALTRFPAEPVRSPDTWFAEAHEVGLGVELELAAFERALAYQSQLPEQAFLAVNIGPLAIAGPETAAMLADCDPDRVVIELTEHVRIDDYPSLARTFRCIRDTGVRLAIDDAGSGFSSLSHILKLAPDFIKLDRDLTAGIDVDPVRRALASSLVSFATETGAVIIAEGIETREELEELRRLGIGYGQGFYLGRPCPVEALPVAKDPVPARARRRA